MEQRSVRESMKLDLFGVVNNILEISRNKRFKKSHNLLLTFLILISVFGNLPLAHGKLTIIKECGEIVCKPHQYCSQVDHSCRPCQVTCDPALGNYDKAVCEKDCQDYLHDLWYMRKPDNDSSGQEELYIDLYYKMEQDLRLLKILIGVVIILSTVVMLALFSIMIYFKRLRNRLHLQALNSSGDTPYLKKSKRRIEDLPVIYSNSKVLSLPFPDGNGPSSHISSSINNNMSRGSSPDLVSRTVTLSNPYTGKTREMRSHKDHKGSSMSVGMTQHEKQQQKFRKEPSESTLPDYHACYDNPGLVPSLVHNVHM